MNCCTVSIATLSLTLLLLLAYLTAARWLQQRSAWLTPHAEVDAVYILAGAPSRGERMEAALDWAWQYDGQPCPLPISPATNYRQKPQIFSECPTANKELPTPKCARSSEWQAF